MSDRFGPSTYTGSSATWHDVLVRGGYPVDATPEYVLAQIFNEALAKMTPRRRRRALANIDRIVRDARNRWKAPGEPA